MLSIIIPTLNEEKYLPRLLDSIKSQNFSDYEIIVSDGGSIDKTKQIALDNQCVFLVDNEHHNPAWQRNNGAAVAKGETLLFIDCDSVLPNDFLNQSCTEFSRRQLTGAAFYISFNPNKASYRLYALIFNIFCWFRQYFAPAAVGAAILVKKTAHEAIAGFDVEVQIAEDFDYAYRASSQGRFGMIGSTCVLFSARRLEEEGEIKMVVKWLRMAGVTLFHTKIKDKVVDYDFGKHKGPQ
jgi:glycosyltransferase involved in cell wall biosynthesis